MRMLRRASFEEFVRWYLARERRKRNSDSDLSSLPWESLRTEMLRTWPGKLRPWFEEARWSIVSLDSITDAMSLICVDNWETRQSRLVCGSGPDNRLARTVIASAWETGYFDNPEVQSSNSVEAHFRQERITAFRKNWPELRDGERLTICNLNADEKAANPSGTFYLHDGFGRLLAYLYATVYEGREYRPIEAFLAEKH